MDERAGQIVSQLSEQRQRLGDDIFLLERKLRGAANRRAYFIRRLLWTVGLAVGGLLVYTRLRSR